MVPFHQICPQLAERESRTVAIPSSNGLVLPAGEYGMLESYCTEPDCDCQRVLLTVMRSWPANPDAVLSRSSI